MIGYRSLPVLIALPTVMEVLAHALCMPTATSVTSDTAQLYGTVSRKGYGC